MPAIEAIADDPEELRRTLRDVVALSMLPATWVRHDARQIAASVTEVLVRMLGLEFALMALRWRDRPETCVARAKMRIGPEQAATIQTALAPALGEPPRDEVLTLANPLATGSVRIAIHPVAAGEASLILAASTQPGFPTSAQRLLLGLGANQAAIAIRKAQAEQELQFLNETLELRVEAEVDSRMKIEEAYRQAQKMEAIGQLTGGIAHDFNNLLAAVLGNLELLRKRLGDDEESMRLIRGAVDGAERGKLLTQRLLAFARQQDLKPAALDAAALLRDVIEMLRSSIGPSIAIHTDVEAGLWPVHADANHLQLALLNLALNARDAMPDGGSLTLSARNESVAAEAGAALAAGDYVCLTVADTGAGMDQATLARASDPFFTTKGVGKGTGLGLSMVDGMAAQSGGSLRLSSRLGGGTRAELRLPRSQSLPPAPAVTTSLPPDSAPPCTILLVDDDPLICMATSSMLQDLGHSVVTASSGQRALEILRAGTAVDVVFTDQAMPGMTGLQLAAEIRASWPQLPILLTTGYAELPENAVLKLPRLDKPYGQDELAAAIASVARASTSSS